MSHAYEIAQQPDLIMEIERDAIMWVILGEHFLKSEGEQGKGEGENQTVKTKKAPLREGPKYLITPWWAQKVADMKISYQIHIRHFVLYFPDLLDVSCLLLVSVTSRLNR